jgi:hypothetical protein
MEKQSKQSQRRVSMNITGRASLPNYVMVPNGCTCGCRPIEGVPPEPVEDVRARVFPHFDPRVANDDPVPPSKYYETKKYIKKQRYKALKSARNKLRGNLTLFVTHRLPFTFFILPGVL